MKIWITGATGLLGAAVSRRARERGHSVIEVGFQSGWSQPPGPRVQRRRIDLRNENAVTRELLEDFPDAIVNAAAFTEKHQCIADPESARQLNVILPGILGKLSHHLSARLVHISSEQVFSGEGPLDEPILRDTLPSPRNLYGELKLHGETEALELGGDFTAVVRLPLLQGNSPSGTRSFHERLFQMWVQGKKPDLFTDQYRQTCTAESAAEALIEICEKTTLRGVLHWAGQECLSRYELGKAIARHFKLPEDWVTAGSMSGKPEFEDHPPRLPLSITPLDRELRTRPETLEEQLDRLVVPPPVRTWYHDLPPLEDLPSSPKT